MYTIEVLILLDRLNKALHKFQNSTSEEEKEVADKQFAEILDQLLEANIPCEYDEHTNKWYRIVRGIVS